MLKIPPLLTKASKNNIIRFSRFSSLIRTILFLNSGFESPPSTNTQRERGRERERERGGGGERERERERERGGGEKEREGEREWERGGEREREGGGGGERERGGGRDREREGGGGEIERERCVGEWRPALNISVKSVSLSLSAFWFRH